MNQSSFNGRSPSTVAAITFIADQALTAIAIVIGFGGNAKVCYFFVQRQDLRKVPHYLFASLAVNGIISSLFTLPSRLAMFASVGLGRIDYAERALNITGPSSFLCAVVNFVTLSLMAIDRQDCVLRPFNRRITPSNVKFFIAGKWIGALLVTSVLIFVVLFDQSVNPVTFFAKMSDLKRNPIFIYHILGVVLNVITLIIVIVTAIRVIKRIRSSTLPDAASLHRRQENKLTWLTYKISGVCVACWVPQFICTGLLASGVHRDMAINAVVITSTVGYYNYVLNPLVYHGIMRTQKRIIFLGKPTDMPSVLTKGDLPTHSQEMYSFPEKATREIYIDPTEKNSGEFDI